MNNKTTIYRKSILLSFLMLMPFLINTLYAQRSNVPEWFLNAEKYNSKNYAIGVSNPEMEAKAAFKQAKIRALLNYSILHYSNVKSLTTLSLGNQTNNPARIENLEYMIYTNLLNGKMPQLNQVSLIDSFYNNNREAIVLLGIKSDENIDSSKIIYQLTRRAAFQHDQRNFPIAVDDLTYYIYDHDSIIESFSLEKDGYKFKTPDQNKKRNVFDEERIYRPYYYGINGSTIGENPDNSMLPCPLNSGLWNSYIFSLVDQICIKANFEQDLQYKLSTNNLGNSDNKISEESYQQFVYSLKNLNSSKLQVSIQKLGISNNNLFLGFAGNSENQADFSIPKNKSSKKELKKIKDEKWKVFGKPDLTSAWFAPTNLMKNNGLIHASSEIQANNLQSGIIEAINFAKLELSSQLGSKISSLNNMNNTNNEQTYLNTSKISNKEKTAKIDPYFIFYSKINEKAYQIKVVLFYKINEID